MNDGCVISEIHRNECVKQGPFWLCCFSVIGLLLTSTPTLARLKNPILPGSVILKYEKNSTLVRLTHFNCNEEPVERVRKAVLSSLAQASLRAEFPYFVIQSEFGEALTMNGTVLAPYCVFIADLLTEGRADEMRKSGKATYVSHEVIDEYGLWRDIYWRDKNMPKNVVQ